MPSAFTHDCSQRSQSGSKKWNGTIGHISGWPAVQHPSKTGAVVHRPRACNVHFPESQSRAPRSPNIARNAVPIAAGIALTAAAAALLNRWLAKKAEDRNPPIGRFITVDGVRLHYVDRGTGRPLILLHGNGSMIEDFQSSGLIDLAAKNYRVIVFDRPGFGHSERPRRVVWTPQAQADLIASALRKIGVSKPTVLGHSWGTLVAVALALRYPHEIQALILVSGYYYPSARVDLAFASLPALPIIGDLASHTISPLLARLMWSFLLRKIFGPSSVPKKFEGFPEEMAVRPSQLRAASAESALMIPAARAFQKAYRELRMPVSIVAGADDRFVESEQSSRLHREISQSILNSIPANGHMVHQTATVKILSVIDTAAHQQGALP